MYITYQIHVKCAYSLRDLTCIILFCNHTNKHKQRVVEFFTKLFTYYHTVCPHNIRNQILKSILVIQIKVTMEQLVILYTLYTIDIVLYSIQYTILIVKTIIIYNNKLTNNIIKNNFFIYRQLKKKNNLFFCIIINFMCQKIKKPYSMKKKKKITKY